MKGTNSVVESTFMGGVVYNFGEWGGGFAFSGYLNSINSQVSISDSQNITHEIPVLTQANNFSLNVPVGKELSAGTWVGASFFSNLYTQSISVFDNSGASHNSSGLALGFSVGAIHQINSQFSIGSWFKSPATNYLSLSVSKSQQGTTLAYSEDIALHYPWILAGGLSYKPTHSRNEFFFDLDLVGPTANGSQLTYDTFSAAINQTVIRNKGQYAIIEPRLGYRRPLFDHDRGTLHAGTYLETSRWEGLPSRLHLTGGISYFAREWLELLGGADVANNFFQLFLTFR